MQPDDHADSRQLLQSTVDGPVGPLAPKLVVAGLSLAHAVIRHLRMVARLASGPRLSRATSNRVQVCMGGDEWVSTCVVCRAIYGVDAQAQAAVMYALTSSHM